MEDQITWSMGCNIECFNIQVWFHDTIYIISSLTFYQFKLLSQGREDQGIAAFVYGFQGHSPTGKQC